MHQEFFVWRLKLTDKDSKVKPDEIKDLSLKQTKADLYDGKLLEYGEMNLRSDDGTETLFLYTVADVLVNEYEKGINTPKGGYQTPGESAGILKY